MTGAARDDLAIRGVLARIAHLSDHGDLDDYGNQFAEDVVWEMPGAPAKHGRAQIVAAGAGRRLESVGHYRDAFRRGPSGWRVAHRRITLG